MKPIYWNDAIRKLGASDPILKKIIDKNQDKVLTTRRNAFDTLIKAIIGQQISVKAAESVYNKLVDRIGPIVNPKIVQSCQRQTLKQVGLSRQKVDYILNISEFFIQNPDLVSDEYLEIASIADITNNFIKIKGIGSWTVEMFLIFYAMKPDILPLKDIGLLNAIKNVYNLRQLSKEDQLEKIVEISDCWRPYRTVATWYLWLFIDDELVEY
ncbi:MAG: DNA-3-methyladenine glycosylase family protein [Alphaproteobacteria bacterium]